MELAPDLGELTAVLEASYDGVEGGWVDVEPGGGLRDGHAGLPGDDVDEGLVVFPDATGRGMRVRPLWGWRGRRVRRLWGWRCRRRFRGWAPAVDLATKEPGDLGDELRG